MGKERFKIFARGERKLGHIKTQKAKRSTQEVQTVHWPKNPIETPLHVGVSSNVAIVERILWKKAGLLWFVSMIPCYI